MIVRAPKTGDFSVLSNAGANDRSLRGLARAILWHLLSKPDGWHVNTKYLMAEFGCGRDAILRALNELEAACYLRRACYSKNGVWHHFSIVYEVPHPKAQPTAAEPLPCDEPPIGLFADAEVTEWADERRDFLAYKRQSRRGSGPLPRAKPHRSRTALKGRSRPLPPSQ